MEWAIPLQKLEVGKVQIGESHNTDKSIVPLAYFDGQNNFSNLNILLPVLRVKEFDLNSGKLLLDFKKNTQFEAKMNALQSTLLGAVYIQQQHWFNGYNYSLETLQKLFKPIIDNGILNLYYPVQKSETSIKIYKDGKWYSKLEPGMIQENTNVRIMFRIQGICFHKNQYNNVWSGKFRLQHRIYAILI